MSDNEWKQQQKDNWLRLLKSGDQQAFAEFIDNYKETVFLCCRRLGLGEHEVEDVAGETFLAAYRGLSRYAGQAELSTWLWSIAYRQAISFLRKNRRYRQLETEPDDRIADDDRKGPTAVAESRETERIVWAAVDQLPRLWAMAVILFYREQKSVADIAKIMNTKENTVKTYLFRGRERLKTALTPAFSENRT
ncbi:MAG: sigma-70 family RNA polymerase sigma factor [Phycisphaerales bacterium]|nr:MAG: sigma-70 family RNA polymerase sigma factor [Phycisphaerales bacterium]